VAIKYPIKIRLIAIAILFVPSVTFWGSGILKDTVTLGALGWLTYAMIHIIDLKHRGIFYWLVALGAAWLIFNIKIYILICYLPTVFIWVYWAQLKAIKSSLFRILIGPFLFVIFAAVGFATLSQISAQSERYSLDLIAERAAITAYDIRYGWGARMSGDGGYDLGTLDGTWQSMIRLMPAAINASLFRPYLWEVKNPLMLLSAFESIILLVLTIWLGLIKGNYKNIFQDPFLVFCLIFSLLFSFAVGISTFNFGTLMRYKIPMLPFYFIVLFLSSRKIAT
jgi:hypothetical protein